LTWETIFALLSREYGWTVEQILKLTKPQVNFYLRFVRDFTNKELEYEEVPGAKEFMNKIKESYVKAGKEVPPIA